jgi:hypothetical protein
MIMKRMLALTTALFGSLASALAMACSPEDLSSIPLADNIDYATQVQPIFNASCTGCHGGAAGLSLGAAVSLGNLVNVASTNANAGIPRVTPGNPAASFLFRKINCTALGAGLGLRMPRNGPPHLGVEQQALIMDWILDGARAQADPDRIFGSGVESRPAVGAVPPFP